MNILGVGPLELVFFLLIALLVLGPEDIVKASKKAGKWLGKFRRSETWDNVVKMSEEVKKIPKNLLEESKIEEIKEDLKKTGKIVKEDFININELNRELNRDKYKVQKDNNKETEEN